LADYPSVFPENPVFPVGPGGTQVRVPRRRTRREEKNPPRESDESEWRELLERAVAELNEEFRKHRTPYACRLHEDDTGFLLRVLRLDTPHPRLETPEGPSEEISEELLEPSDLPAWLARLRAGLGILLDREI
jgi:hypothetical protein